MSKKSSLSLLTVALAALAVFVGSDSHAQVNYTWTGGDGAAVGWAATGNWAGSVPPGTFASGNFIFNEANVTGGNGSNAVNVSVGGTASSLTYSGTTLSFQTFLNGGKVLVVDGPITVQSGSHSVASTSGIFGLTANTTFQIAESSRLTVATVLSGAGTLAKQGAGTLEFQTPASFTGATQVSAGTLLLSGTGSLNNTTSVSVAEGASFLNNSSTAFTQNLILAEGAVLGGSGVSGAEFQASSVLINGNLEGGEFVAFSLNETGFTKGGALEFSLLNPTIGNYTIFTGSALDGEFVSLTINGTSLTSLGGGNFEGVVEGLTYSFTNSSNVLAVIPEPGTCLLLAVGMMALLRRKRCP